MVGFGNEMSVRYVYEPTKNAAAGNFQSRGEDLFHYLDKSGSVVCGLDHNGSLFAVDVVANGASLSDLATTVQSLVSTGLPPFVDAGTF